VGDEWRRRCAGRRHAAGLPRSEGRTTGDPDQTSEVLNIGGNAVWPEWFGGPIDDVAPLFAESWLEPPAPPVFG
jgi:hypothetical protein